MERRREARQLRSSDVIELTLSIKAEVAADAESSPTGKALLRIKPLPCGANCGTNCECDFSAFADLHEPAQVQLKGNQRVPFIGNLAELLAEQKAMQERIAMIEASRGNGRSSRTESQPDETHASGGEE